MDRTFVLRQESDAKAFYAVLKNNWRAFSKRGHPLAVTVAEHKSKRSIEQNKRYWAILHNIADNAWVAGKQFSAEAWHENFKREWIGTEDLPGGGGVCGISTTSLNTAEFATYCDKIEVYAATDLGIEI